MNPRTQAVLKLRVLTTLLASVCLIQNVYAGMRAGLDAYDRKDYVNALLEFRTLADQGDAHAQNNLGVLYARGEGVSRIMQRPSSGTASLPNTDSHWRKTASD